MLNSSARVRGGLGVGAAREIELSRKLLLELSTQDPTVLQCLAIIRATCLTQGVRCYIDEEPCGEDFQAFVDEHYVAFCQQALHAMFAYGFVPWFVRKTRRRGGGQRGGGEDVPSVVPPGAFSWTTELTHHVKHVQERDPGLVCYVVRLVGSTGMRDENVRVFATTPPTVDVCGASALYATVPSPMAHVITDYKNLRQAQLRRAHADAWNSTAKLICAFKPATKVQEDPSTSLMDFADESYLQGMMDLGIPGVLPLQAMNMWTRDASIRGQVGRAVSGHAADVVTLPRDHDVVKQDMLAPCEDLEFLLLKYQRDVCFVFGVPPPMVASNDKGHETEVRTVAAGRVFSSRMLDLCKQLERLLGEVYLEIYGKANARFVVLPLSRIEIQSMDDLKVLHEIGGITPDLGLQLSHLLLGDEVATHRRHVDMEAAMAGAGGMVAGAAAGPDSGGRKRPGQQQRAAVERIKETHGMQRGERARFAVPPPGKRSKPA